MADIFVLCLEHRVYQIQLLSITDFKNQCKVDSSVIFRSREWDKNGKHTIWEGFDSPPLMVSFSICRPLPPFQLDFRFSFINALFLTPPPTPSKSLKPPYPPDRGVGGYPLLPDTMPPLPHKFFVMRNGIFRAVVRYREARKMSHVPPPNFTENSDSQWDRNVWFWWQPIWFHSSTNLLFEKQTDTTRVVLRNFVFLKSFPRPVLPFEEKLDPFCS